MSGRLSHDDSLGRLFGANNQRQDRANNIFKFELHEFDTAKEVDSDQLKQIDLAFLIEF